MDDLGRQLRDWVEVDAPPIAIEELAPPPPSRRRAVRAAVVVAGLALVVAAVAAAQRYGDVPFVPVIGDRDGVQPSVEGSCLDGDDHQRVDGIDLDGDGLEDRARLHVGSQTLVVCLGNGQTRQGSTDDGGWAGPRTAIEAVDLGGTDGIALIHDSDDRGFRGREVILVHWFSGGLGAVGAKPNPDRDAPPDLGEGKNLAEGTGQGGDVAYGCRPPTVESGDFEIVQLSRWRAYVDVVSELLPKDLVLLAPENMPDVSAVASEPDLHKKLRELGFTPRCVPEE